MLYKLVLIFCLYSSPEQCIVGVHNTDFIEIENCEKQYEKDKNDYLQFGFNTGFVFKGYFCTEKEETEEFIKKHLKSLDTEHKV